jgi:hypothetical protein
VVSPAKAWSANIVSAAVTTIVPSALFRQARRIIADGARRLGQPAW